MAREAVPRNARLAAADAVVWLPDRGSSGVWPDGTTPAPACRNISSSRSVAPRSSRTSRPRWPTAVHRRREEPWWLLAADVTWRRRAASGRCCWRSPSSLPSWASRSSRGSDCAWTRCVEACCRNRSAGWRLSRLPTESVSRVPARGWTPRAEPYSPLCP